MKKVILSLLSILFISIHAYGQWIQTDGPYGLVIINDLEKVNSILVAATDKGVYAKHDNDTTWHRQFTHISRNMSRAGDSIFTTPYHYLGIMDLSGSQINPIRLPYQGSPLINSPSIAYKDSLLYVASSKGVYVSSDLGASSNLFINGLDMDTSVSGGTTNYFLLTHEVIATDNYLYCATAKGVYRSDYTLSKWEKKLDDHTQHIYEGANALYAITYDSLYRSTNQGDTWTAIHHNVAGSIGELNGDIYAVNAQGVIKSSDNGQSWSTMNTGLPSQRIQRVESLEGELYCVYEFSNIYKWDGNQWQPESQRGLINTWMRGVETTAQGVFALDVNKGVFKYNHNNTWTNVSPSTHGKFVAYEDMRSYRDTLYAMTSVIDTINNQRNLEMCYSHDDGQSWTCVAGPNSGSSMPVNYGLFKVIDGTFYFYNDDHVLRTNDLGQPWEDISPFYSSGCPGRIYDLHRFNGNLYISGCDINTLRRYDENQQSWIKEINYFTAGNEANLLIPRDTFLYVNTYNGLYRRSANVTSYTKMASLDTTAVYASDYLNIGKSLYITGNRNLYRSTDEGQSWTALDTDLPENWGTVDVGVFADTLFMALYDFGVVKHPLPADPVSLGEISAKPSLAVFPNPAKDDVQIRLPKDVKTAAYTITDLSGKIQLSGTLERGASIPVKSLTVGSYILSVKAAAHAYSTKLLIER